MYTHNYRYNYSVEEDGSIIIYDNDNWHEIRKFTTARDRNPAHGLFIKCLRALTDLNSVVSLDAEVYNTIRQAMLEKAFHGTLGE